MKSESESEGAVDILKPNKVAQAYDTDQRLSADLMQYEKQVIEKYHGMDVYRAKGKARSKISFTDLTLTENLNYIKHNLKNSD